MGMERLERSVISTEIRSAGEGDDARVAGLGIIYDEWAELWPKYKERILRGAAKPAKDAVKSFFNHDPSQVLSTTDSNPPLVIRQTERGIEYDSPIPPTSYGKDLIANLERRNVKGSSFTFSVPKGGDRIWEDNDGVMHREISELIYYEIGPVTDPAYVATTADMRSTRSARLDEWRSNQSREDEPTPEPKPENTDRSEDVARLLRHGELKATL